MLFTKTLEVNGVQCTHHQTTKVELTMNDTVLGVWFDSWPDEACRLNGTPAIGKAHVVLNVAGLDCTGGLLAGIAAGVAADDLFVGATQVADANLTLDTAKDRKWADIKSQRCTAESAGFTWDSSVFDSDPMSQGYIQGAVQLAMLAAQAAQSFSIDWTLSDNTVRTLSGADAIAVGQALAAHVEACHAQGRTLRAAIEAATTQEQLDAVQWV